MSTGLPIDAIRGEVDEAFEQGAIVVTSPTGSGKSTQIPRWCRARGSVLVVEPRRVACRSLAHRVAELEGCPLGGAVGYSVRDDHRSTDNTEILFATTGVVLRMLAGGDDLPRFSTVILDEVHERSLDVDLLLALFARRRARPGGGLVVMSATLAGDRVAEHLGGRLLHAPGRLYPIERRYLPAGGDLLLPDLQGLEDRLRRALASARDLSGDILVFLPGKGEIASAARTLDGTAELDIIPLHGGLSLRQQSLAFAPSDRRKVILATNVAETSITLPGVGVVIDSGLVRRTRYHRGRGYLMLAPIAKDSAEQRAGRAGRTAPGTCFCLWNETALLERSTPPEIHREALTPLVLAAAACGATPEDLSFLDPPKEYALAAAREDLQALGALSAEGSLTERGRRLFGLPVDAALGRLLIEAEAQGDLEDVIDLVGLLAVGRPLFRGQLAPEDDEEDDPRALGCDATAALRMLRAGRAKSARDRVPRSSKVDGFVLAEGRVIAERLRRAFGLARRGSPTAPIDRRRLAAKILAADPRSAHVARVRRGKTTWSNGGTELVLARESALSRSEVPAIAVLDTRALGTGGRKTKLIATCAVPLELATIAAAGLGQEHQRNPQRIRGRLVTTVERVYARKVIETREETPRGAMAREAIRDLFLRGTLFRETLPLARRRLESLALLDRLQRAGLAGEIEPWLDATETTSAGVGSLEQWVLGRLEALGVESGDDLALLDEADFLPPKLDVEIQRWLDRTFPSELKMGDARYDLEYDLTANEVVLHKRTGHRQEPPPASWLPPFPGFRVVMRDRSRVFVIRSRR